MIFNVKHQTLNKTTTVPLSTHLDLVQSLKEKKTAEQLEFKWKDLHALCHLKWKCQLNINYE